MPKRRIVGRTLHETLDPDAREAASAALATWRARWESVPDAAWALAEIDALGEDAERVAHRLRTGELPPRAAAAPGTMAVLLVATFDAEVGWRAVELLWPTRDRRAGAMLLAGLEHADAEAALVVGSMARLAVGCFSARIDTTATVYPGADPSRVSATGEHPVLDEETTERVVALLDHPVEPVRAAVAEALAVHEASGARYDDVYRAVLDRSGDAAMTRALATMATARRDRSAAPALRSMAAGEGAAEVFRALAALGDLEPALAAIEAGDEQAPSILTAVGDHGAKRGRDFLLSVLEDEARPLALRESALTWFSERRQHAVVKRWSERIEALRAAATPAVAIPADAPAPEPTYRVFRHPSGTEWQIAQVGAALRLRIVMDDGDVIERTRNASDPSKAAAELERLVAEQIAEGFVEVDGDAT